jgi:hypothetical protein
MWETHLSCQQAGRSGKELVEGNLNIYISSSGT